MEATLESSKTKGDPEMANPKIRVVAESEPGPDFSEAELDAAMSEAVGKTRIATRTLIVDTKTSLTKTLSGLREHVSNIETEMAQANADFERAAADAKAQYEKAVAEAKTWRDDILTAAKADMFQVKATISALDGARTKLAENAAS